MKMNAREKHTVHWFRKGLRLHDNPALRSGIKGATTLRCIFIIDPWFAGSSNVGINKWRFLLQCLEDLDRGLRKLNSRLFVIRGQPAEALPKLFKEWGTTCLTFEEDPEPFGKVRDQNVTEMCKELGIEVIPAVSHTLYKLDSIIERNNSRAPLTYHKFQSVIASMDPPSQAEPAINQEILGNTYTPIMDDHDEKYNVPTLDELGFDTEGLKPPVWVGGETAALTRLERHLERKAWVASFGRPKMTPQSLLATQTGLSPYLRFGCLSTRLFYHQLTDLYKKIKKTMPSLSLHGQLLWREFFYCAATKNSNFDKMEGNQICVQIPWDKNPEVLAKWSNGQTGFPWIDAIMTQLREEGWIHHLARHAVACFLTRGDLWISWEEGMKVFEELLLDADWSNNAGMWMWLSCSSFFQQFFHCYCPVRFGRKADPNGDYIRRFLPVLNNFPTKYIHEPWIAPESVQRAAKCVVGKDYPVPMVNHAVVSRTNMERMKQVYQHLSKYRIPLEDKENSHKGIINTSENPTYIPYAVSSPSPTTVITNTNNSGNYLCQQVRHSQPTSTIISSDYQHQHQQQQQQQIQINQHKFQQINEQQSHFHDNHQLETFYVKDMPEKSSSANANNYYCKTEQHQQLHSQTLSENNDSVSINIYDNMRQLQHQHSESQNNSSYENQFTKSSVNNINENFKYQQHSQYNRIKVLDNLSSNKEHQHRFKQQQQQQQPAVEDTNFPKQFITNNNSVIMHYSDNNFDEYVNNLNNEHFKNYYPCVVNDGVAVEDVQSEQNRSHNVNDRNINKNLTNIDQDNNKLQEQYQNIQQLQQMHNQYQQQQIHDNSNFDRNNLKFNFECEVKVRDN